MTEQTVAELQGLLRDLAAAPRAIQAGTRRALRDAGQTILADARANAGYSDRIPAATQLRVTLAGDRPGIELRVDRKAAPHGRVMEGFSGLTFRHPVFEVPGRPVVWVDQRARPYLVPAVTDGTADLVRAVYETADEALSQHNL